MQASLCYLLNIACTLLVNASITLRARKIALCQCMHDFNASLHALSCLLSDIYWSAVSLHWIGDLWVAQVVCLHELISLGLRLRWALARVMRTVMWVLSRVLWWTAVRNFGAFAAIFSQTARNCPGNKKRLVYENIADYSSYRSSSCRPSGLLSIWIFDSRPYDGLRQASGIFQSHADQKITVAYFVTHSMWR